MAKRKTKALTVTEDNKPKPYVMTDVVYGEFTLKPSANAWWMTPEKVRDLVNAFKYDATVEEACIHAGISRGQWEYFNTVHPEFSVVMERCREVPTLKARQSVITQMTTDGNLAFKYLERKKPGEFGQKTPIMAVQINMAEKVAATKAKYQQ